jgi:DMSO reductase family type II enzyme chaperone
VTGGSTGSISPEAALYSSLAEISSFPSPQLASELACGSLQATVGDLGAALSPAVSLPLAHLPRDPAVGPKSLEAEYIRLFDLPGRPSTPMYTGVYAARRRDAMEELLRSYRHFGLTVVGGSGELPDAVPTVLEFLAFLSQSAEAADLASRPAPERAAADILERHLCPWAAETATRLSRREPLPLYRALVDSILALAASRLPVPRGRHGGLVGFAQGASVSNGLADQSSPIAER